MFLLMVLLISGCNTNNFPKLTVKEISELIGRTFAAVNARKKELGLKKFESFSEWID